MFLNLNHKKFDVYVFASKLLKESYKMVESLPERERYNLISQIKRAALSVKLNIAEGASRKSSNERMRFYEIARGSVVELDAAFEACVELGYLEVRKLDTVGILLNHCFAILSKMAGR
jgi:four helix bundle protein